MPEDIYSRKYHKLPLIPVIQSGGKEDTVDGPLPSTESRYVNNYAHGLQEKCLNYAPLKDRCINKMLGPL